MNTFLVSYIDKVDEFCENSANRLRKKRMLRAFCCVHETVESSRQRFLPNFSDEGDGLLTLLWLARGALPPFESMTSWAQYR